MNIRDTAVDAPAAERLAEVRRRLARACRDAGREDDAARLIAVSKTFAADDIRPVLEAGQRLFGENRVQEAKAKWPELKTEYPDAELHLIGPLQTNKVREALALFDVIHTVDRPSLASTLAKEISRLSHPAPRLLVQVNTGEEAQKAGVMPEEADAFIDQCRTVHGLRIEGLMCIPPADEAPAPHFALLVTIARRNGLEVLSMGMSGDFEVAATLGATYVRVGSAIFGAR